MVILLIYTVPITYQIFFFFNDPATTEIYTLSLHDALPILSLLPRQEVLRSIAEQTARERTPRQRCNLLTQTLIERDRKSTRLNSSHSQISYAVFCLKKKKKISVTYPRINVPISDTILALAL